MALTTARQRTEMVRRALADAGHIGRVTSRPASHSAQMTIVDQVVDIDAVTPYLTGYLGEDAQVHACDGFVSIAWAE